MESLAVREIEDRRRVLSVNQGVEGYIFRDHYKMYLNVFLVRTTLSIAEPKFYVSYK